MIRIDTVETAAGFGALRSEWNALLRASAADGPFLTWEWLFSWWTHLRGGQGLRLHVVRDGETAIGIAPFVRVPARPARLRLMPGLELLGSGTAGSDYLDVIARRGREHDVVDALAPRLERDAPLLRWRNLREDGTVAELLAGRLEAAAWRGGSRPVNVCPYVALDVDSWDAFLGRRGASQRYTIRRKLRRIEREHAVELRRVEREAERRPALRTLFELHHRRWDARGGSDGLGTRATWDFHDAFTARALECGWLRLYELLVDGRAAAALYGLRYGSTLHFYQSGFDPAFGTLSVGMVLMAYSIRAAIEEGAREYDFLHGDEGYKLHWADGARTLVDVELFPPSLVGAATRGLLRAARGARRRAAALALAARPAVPRGATGDAHAAAE